MKKKLLIIVISLFLINTGKAQDLIIKNNGDTIKAKILEVTDEAIRYKKTNNIDGPTFVTNKNELSKVVYANGTEEKIEAKATVQPTKIDPPSGKSEPNIDTRSDGKNTDIKSNSEFEKITMEPFGLYYKGMRMNDTRLLYLYRSFGDASILKEYKAAKTNKTASTILGLSSIPFGVGGIMLPIISIIPSFDTDADGNKIYPNRNLLVPGIAMLACFIGLEVTSIVLNSTYKSKLKKTVNHYNSVIAKHDLN